jgi:chitinase
MVSRSKSINCKVNYKKKFILDIPALWHKRIEFYNNLHNSTLVSENNLNDTDKISITPSKFGNFIYSNEIEKHAKQHSNNNNNNNINKKLICYYTTPRFVSKNKKRRRSIIAGESLLDLKDINPNLCTHINIGIIEISNCSLVIDEDLITAFEASNELKRRNEKLKILLWVGGADESTGFPEMVKNHQNRKKFIQSLKETYEKYTLDGVDLDWEFPDGSNSQRIHFMQLLHEIRREYQREHSTYLLSIAVAAPAAFVDMCYDVRMINENVDFVNVMTYDYHFYSKGTPYTGEIVKFQN